MLNIWQRKQWRNYLIHPCFHRTHIFFQQSIIKNTLQQIQRPFFRSLETVVKNVSICVSALSWYSCWCERSLQMNICKSYLLKHSATDGYTSSSLWFPDIPAHRKELHHSQRTCRIFFRGNRQDDSIFLHSDRAVANQTINPKPRICNTSCGWNLTVLSTDLSLLLNVPLKTSCPPLFSIIL